MKPLFIAFVILVAGVAPATGDVLYPAALTLEAGYAIGPAPGFPWSAYPSLGRPLMFVGRVASVGAPFTDLVGPGSPELTYVFQGSTCQSVGNFDDFVCTGGEFGDFYGGTLTIFLDSSPDADFTDLSTFQDGNVVFLAETSVIEVLDDDPHESCPMLDDRPDLHAYFHIVGGLWFDRVSNGAEGFDGICRGELEGEVPAPLQSIGYVFRADGVVDIDGALPVTTATWGAVKALYR